LTASQVTGDPSLLQGTDAPERRRRNTCYVAAPPAATGVCPAPYTVVIVQNSLAAVRTLGQSPHRTLLPELHKRESNTRPGGRVLSLSR